MKHSIRSLALSALAAACASALFSTAVYAQQGSAPVYKPPLRGAPASRVGGGSRTVGLELPRLYAYAPQEIGFTSKPKPDLYWFASAASPAKIQFSIYTGDPAKPLLEQELPAIATPGTQRVRLSDFNFELQPKMEYRWRITIIDETGGRTSRGIAGGTISRVDMWQQLDDRLRKTPAEGQAGVLAEEGLWYDAIEALSNDIQKGSATAKQYRAGLLSQVGLNEASQFDGGGK